MTDAPKTTVAFCPGKDGSLSIQIGRGAAYAYIDCGPNDALHVYHDLPGRPKFELVGKLTDQVLLDQLDVIESALEA